MTHIPHEFPITGLHQVSRSDSNGVGNITCYNSSGIARLFANGKLQTEGVTEARNGATATLLVHLLSSNFDSFQNVNRDLLSTSFVDFISYWNYRCDRQTHTQIFQGVSSYVYELSPQQLL